MFCTEGRVAVECRGLHDHGGLYKVENSERSALRGVWSMVNDPHRERRHVVKRRKERSIAGLNVMVKAIEGIRQ